VPQPGPESGTVGAVIVAAGRGERFGAPKQFLLLNGVRLVDYAVTACREFADHTVVVLPPGAVWQGAPVHAAVAGGDQRSDSVRAGLAALPATVEIVIVHDAARPLASPDLFRTVIDAVRGGADAAVPGIPVSDTLKRVEGMRVVETVPRESLVAVQTPQAFRAAALRAAHASGGDATDDAALVEAAGGCVVVVAGDADNVKLTTTQDLERAAVLLASRKSSRDPRP
jgi:2-C-methyl-D-erythritol 4-phosphate cytidylyltransferase